MQLIVLTFCTFNADPDEYRLPRLFSEATAGT